MTCQDVSCARSTSEVPHLRMRQFFAGVLLIAAFLSGPSLAQEVRYSWLDLSFIAHDIDRQGSQTPIPGQMVDVTASDGDGVRFRGSFGTWNNFYLFVDYASSDIDIAVVITNSQGVFTDNDEFDLTTIRGGVGFKYSVAFSADVYAELGYDSIDFDFGSFAGEDFDADEQNIGGTIGVRSMLNDDIDLRAYARYSEHSDFNMNGAFFDPGEFYGAGISWEIVRGLSIVADYESGDFNSWSLGFRMDLDED